MNFPFDQINAITYQDDFFRNIKSIRNTQNLYDDLSEDSADWEAASMREFCSKPKQYQLDPIINRPFDEAQYFNAIAFPFATKNWAASRYSQGHYGVWYGGVEFNTTIYETVHHWRKLLVASNFHNFPQPIFGERRIYKVRCDALLYDFSEKIKQQPLLIDPNDYVFTQQIGGYLQKQGHPGLISHSARCDGKISAIFTAKVLSNPRDYCYLQYRWDPVAQVITVERGNDKILKIK